MAGLLAASMLATARVTSLAKTRLVSPLRTEITLDLPRLEWRATAFGLIDGERYVYSALLDDQPTDWVLVGPSWCSANFLAEAQEAFTRTAQLW